MIHAWWIWVSAGLVLAILLNQKVRGQAIFRACIFVPTVVPLVAAAVVHGSGAAEAGVLPGDHGAAAGHAD